MSNDNNFYLDLNTCSSWNNGNINVFTGKYDFDLGNILDKNLWTIQEIIKSYPQFATNFYNRQFYLDNTKLDGISTKELIAKVEPKMEGNGFTFANKNNSQITDIKIYVYSNIAFDNKNGGFIYFNHKCKIIMINCVAFNNYINYKLSYTFVRWRNNFGWLSTDSEQLNKLDTLTPSNSDKINKMVYSTRDNIVKSISQNIFPFSYYYFSLFSYIENYDDSFIN